MKGVMLALQKIEPSMGISLQEVSEPCCPAAGEVMIEVAAAGICGSDVHVYHWGPSYEFMRNRLPVTLGHEFCGQVKAVGPGVTNIKLGDLVAAMPTMPCMACSDCIAGNLRRCLNKMTVGLTRDGAFARYVKVSAWSCILLDPGLDPILGALIEPLAVGDNAVEVGNMRFGDRVVVLGPGTIGQAIVRAAAWRGASQIVVVGLNDTERLATAQAVGATHVIDIAATSSIIPEVLTAFDGHGADIVFEATGHHESVQLGLDLLRPDGILVTAGIHSQPVQINLTDFVRKRQQIRAAHGSVREGWERVAQHITAQPESVRPMVSLQMQLSEGERAFERLKQRDVSKIILCP